MRKDNILHEDELLRIKTLIDSANDIAIISHRNPDGDTIGCNLALRYYLKSIGKNVVSICVDKMKDYYLNFEETNLFVTDADFLQFDLIISVDISSSHMLGFDDLEVDLSIDHHVSNTKYAKNNFIAGDACSTSFLVYQIFKYFSWPITRKTATALLLGLYFDTGSFMHSNTDFETLHVAAELTKLGADKSKIVRILFRTMTLPQIKLWGRILEKVKMTENGVVVSVVTIDDVKQCGAKISEVDRVIDFLNMTEGGKLCVLLTEDDNGIIKGSLRTKNDEIDLTAISKLLGGGGHRKAGGFGIPGKIVEDTTIKIVPN
ncbi:MAG: DHH family phosphoesterase [Candidatus Gracilibacteria bacterium]